MKDRDNDQSMLHDTLYKKAITEIGTLKTKLPDEAFASLAREVIKRLSDHPTVSSSSIAFPSDATIEELARALIQPEADAGDALVAGIRAEGASVETVYLAYLAEAARTLGTWWERDEISFSDVTVAAGHIYAVMRSLKSGLVHTGPVHTQREGFFTGVPGENHLLGVSMAADLFRKQGWNIALKRGLDHDEIVHYAAQSRPILIGLSAGGEHTIAPLAKLVIALRMSVPDAAIMVSGAVLHTSYSDVVVLGADIIPAGMDDALAQAQTVWEQSQKRSQCG